MFLSPKRKSTGKLKQKKIIDFFDFENQDDGREDFYAQWEEFKIATEIAQSMPTVENVRKRFDKNEASRYQSLLAEAEDCGVNYFIHKNDHMNARTIRCRIRELSDILESLRTT